MNLRTFERKFIPEPNSGCWLWTDWVIKQGYGHAWHKGKNVRAHRLSWQLYCGPISDDAHVLHKCDTRCCVNPQHLFLGTPADNMRDKVLKGRWKGGGPGKLTSAQVQEIRRRVNAGDVQRSLCNEYGVSPMTISRAARGHSYRSVA